MGLSRLDDAVGRADLLERRPRADERCDRIDLSRLLAPADAGGGKTRSSRRQRGLRPETALPLDQHVWLDCRPAVDDGTPVRHEYRVRNGDRSLGARLSGEIARATDGRGLAPGTVTLVFHGAAGQSFGAFLVRGVSLRLVGEAQDYLGKGMSGGEIVLRPPAALAGDSDRHVIAGNTLLYGATGGDCFIAGRVGERFCVRNSGARAVAEGCGDHGCEYMTAGVAVLLGPTGRNFGAGMSGGVAFVEEHPQLRHRVNPGMVRVEPVSGDEDRTLLHHLISRHAEATGSSRARKLLRDFNESVLRFRKVNPRSAPEQAAVAVAEAAAAGAPRVA
jgi:glutamate synthase (ferredoxin)